jgi:DNA ligase-1
MLEVIDAIAATPGTLDKVALLAQHNCEELRRVLVAAYDTRLRYYIIDPEMPSGAGIHDLGDDTWCLLAKLSNRQAGRKELLEHMMGLNPSAQELLRRVINKDLRADIGDSLINRAIPGLIYQPTYMRCSTVNEVDLRLWPWTSGVFSQEKLDGMFVNIDYLGDAVVLHTRQGHVFDSAYFKELINDIKGVLKEGVQYHGELMLEPIVGGPFMARKTSNGIFNSCLKKGTGIPEGYRPVAILWDIKDSSMFYLDRYNFVKELCEKTTLKTIRLVPTKMAASHAEALEHFKEITAAGGEGSVVKKAYFLWRDGTSRDQVKLKKEATCELRVTGYKPGKGAFAATFGSLECISEEGDLVVNVSGFTEAERQMIWNNIDDYMFNVITVKFESVSQDKKGKYSLSQPRFEELRLDKDDADTLDYIKGL